jgi:hypothetical protein
MASLVQRLDDLEHIRDGNVARDAYITNWTGKPKPPGWHGSVYVFFIEEGSVLYCIST